MWHVSMILLDEFVLSSCMQVEQVLLLAGCGGKIDMLYLFLTTCVKYLLRVQLLLGCTKWSAVIYKI